MQRTSPGQRRATGRPGARHPRTKTPPASGGGDSHAGFTLVEVTIILGVLSVLGLVLLPGIGNYLRDARLTRARADIASIHESIERFLEDTGEGSFRCWGNGRRPTTDAGSHNPSDPNQGYTVELLVSDGDTPDVYPDGDIWLWRRAVDGHAIDTLANHLVQNSPGGNPMARYRTPEDLTNAPPEQFPFAHRAGFNARFAWRGPYVSAPVRADPWGNRYAVNVLYLDPVAESDGTVWWSGHVEDVFVLSAGPDEEIDTAYAVDGVVPGDDDLIRVVSGNSE